MFFISSAEYKARPINKGAKKKIEIESNRMARQIQRVASNIFFLMFFLFFRLTILRSERSIKKFAIKFGVESKTSGRSPINKQKNSAAKLLLFVKLFLVIIKTRVKREAIKTRRCALSLKQFKTLISKSASKTR